MIDVRVVYPPPSDARPAAIDGEALGAAAVTRNAWQYLTSHGGGVRVVQPIEPRRPSGWYQPAEVYALAAHPSQTTCVAAIAAPTGRVAVWYGATSGVNFDPADAPFLAISRARDSSTQIALARRAAQAWNSANHKPRRAIAQAACRLLHAQVFAYEPIERDTLLVELWPLDPTRLLEASVVTLQACAALIAIGDECGASALLVDRPAFNFPTPIERS